MARHGKAWQGVARPGSARQGLFGLVAFRESFRRGLV